MLGFVRRITFGREPEPAEAMRWLVHVNPYRREEDRDHFIEGMRLAGLGGKASVLPSSAPVSWPIVLENPTLGCRGGCANRLLISLGG